MAEKGEELLPDFRKLCMDLDLFKDLGQTLVRDPPDLTVFRDKYTSDESKESVENTVKGITQNSKEKQNNIQVNNAKTNTPINPQKPKLRRSQRLKARINKVTRNIRNALKGKSQK